LFWTTNDYNFSPLKSSVLWHIMLYTLLTVIYHLRGPCYLHLQVQTISQARNQLEAGSKQNLTVNRLQGISQKTEVFVTTAVRTLNPILFNQLLLKQEHWSLSSVIGSHIVPLWTYRLNAAFHLQHITKICHTKMLKVNSTVNFWAYGTAKYDASSILDNTQCGKDNKRQKLHKSTWKHIKCLRGGKMWGSTHTKHWLQHILTATVCSGTCTHGCCAIQYTCNR
jgi:hypothetical protein